MGWAKSSDTPWFIGKSVHKSKVKRRARAVTDPDGDNKKGGAGCGDMLGRLATGPGAQGHVTMNDLNEQT